MRMKEADPAGQPRAARYLERRVEEKGLRPRFAAAIIAAAWLVAIVVFGIVQHLVDPATFDNAWLGMWWATQTVTTVGYGDTVPDETSGQLIAVVLMVGGLSLFAVVTGTITSVFVSRAQSDARNESDDQLRRRLDQLDSQLKSLREQLARPSGGPGSPPTGPDPG
jgi:voltage-gated potassium channel Kch